MTRAGKIFAATLLGFLLLQTSCKDAIVDPPIKDPRTYTWTIDTLAYPGSFQTNMYDIWGSSSTNVFVVGHNDQNRGLMWHFDGKQWTDVKLSTTQGGRIQGPIDLAAVYGIGASIVLAVGQKLFTNLSPPPNFLDSSLILRYDGQRWFEETIPPGRNLRTVGGRVGNFWVGGWTNQLLHFDGAMWNRDSLPITMQPGGFFNTEAFEVHTSGDVFAIGNTHYNSTFSTTHYFFRKRQNQWNVLDSFFVAPGRIDWKWGQGDLWMSPSGTLYSCGRGVHRWNGSSWEMLFDHPNFLSRMTGTNDKNILVVGHFGTVFHFNGQDWHQYRQFSDPNNVLWGVWTDGQEVMIVGFTAAAPQKTLILRGK